MKPPTDTTPVVRVANERDIEKKGNEYAKSKGWLVRKFVSPGNNGAPDRIYFREGKVILVEWKKPKGKTTKAQDVQINALRRAGMNVYIVDDAHPALLSLIFD